MSLPRQNGRLGDPALPPIISLTTGPRRPPSQRPRRTFAPVLLQGFRFLVAGRVAEAAFLDRARCSSCFIR